MAIRLRGQTAESLPWWVHVVLWGVLVRSPAPAVAQDAVQWGGLPPGPDAAGYSTEWILDSTRTYHTDLSPLAYNGPRPLMVNLWYPAAAGAMAMQCGEYFAITPTGPSDVRALAEAFGAVRLGDRRSRGREHR
jgi:hypothetical protein